MTKTPESFVSLTSNMRYRRYVASGVGTMLALTLMGCGPEKGAQPSDKKPPTVASSHSSSSGSVPVKPSATESPSADTRASETPTARPVDDGAFATRRVCDAIYVADKGQRVILRPVVNQKNQVLDSADQSAAGVDFMPEPLTATEVEWFKLNGQAFPVGEYPVCKDQELFMNAVKQSNGFTTWQMSAVNHELGAAPTKMPWSPNAIRGSFAGVHLDEGALSCTALLGVVPGYDPRKCRQG